MSRKCLPWGLLLIEAIFVTINLTCSKWLDKTLCGIMKNTFGLRVHVPPHTGESGFREIQKPIASEIYDESVTPSRTSTTFGRDWGQPCYWTVGSFSYIL